MQQQSADPFQAQEVHSSIEEYLGPPTCLACHEIEGEQVFHSVHYQWTGPTPNVPNIPGNAGKGVGGFNTYCGSVETSRRIACSTCHIGNGLAPREQISARQLQNIDCLMCHSEPYQRRAVSPLPQEDLNRDTKIDFADFARFAAGWQSIDCRTSNQWCMGADVNFDGIVTDQDLLRMADAWTTQTRPINLTFADYQGVERTWMLPDETPEGDFSFLPNLDAMTITPLEAARTVHRPTRATCLRCHAYAAGSDCGKRGDLSTITIDPPYETEIHMSVQGENFTCQQCHEFQEHRVIGRGLDLRPNDRTEQLDCQKCHENAPHEEQRLDSHVARVACQSCHIPRFAKNVSTEMDRDWNNPQWFQGLFGGQGGYKPEEIRAQNVVPTYAWYDGTSDVYVRGQIPLQNEAGEYVLSGPHGSVDSETARIHPMKEHLSESALHEDTGQLIPHSTFLYFVTGDFPRAVEAGMKQSGLTGSWRMVRVRAFQTINHGVEPHDNALQCGYCHESLREQEDLRMDLQGELGYALKGPSSQVCTQCHEPEEQKPFKTIHDKHVKDKK
ncbi:MAG: hypothetical protein JW828_16925, partial [Sedimentisphaerales bacterium]|nr:hypothetical protein [Sedimentisphaerales bacterium]